jgi:tRNA-dihydrouridine synthase B
MAAPMAGYTDAAFRLLCRGFGADVVITELISADAVAYAKAKFKNQNLKFKNNNKLLHFNRLAGNKNRSTAELLSFFEEERPIVIQLFGKNPENFAKAAKWISENIKPDGIDINMGCPARKVVGSDHGAALLRNPELAATIIKSVKDNCDCPVSVKTRLGWQNDDEILGIIPAFIEAGISAITIHGRTYKDGFKGISRWKNIYKIKEKWGNNLIVVGNGDINEASDLNYSIMNLDGVAVGRAMFGNPAIFSKLKNKKEEHALNDLILKHATLAFQTKGDHGIVEFRKHLLAYLRGFSKAKELRVEAVKVKELDEITKIATRLKKDLEQ